MNPLRKTSENIASVHFSNYKKRHFDRSDENLVAYDLNLNKTGVRYAW